LVRRDTGRDDRQGGYKGDSAVSVRVVLMVEVAGEVERLTGQIEAPAIVGKTREH
jgi:hypothetical protein